MESRELKDIMYSWLLSEICEAGNAGVSVNVDGNAYSVHEADKLREVMENHYYMKSYISDDSGKIVQIDFDHIEDV